MVHGTGNMRARSATLNAKITSGHPAESMRAPIFQVDAFAAGRFTGNPAAVVVLGSFPADAVVMPPLRAQRW
jgi:hypothetical protein